MNKLPLRLSEIDNVRITRQTRWAVHFEIMQRYYVLKEDSSSDETVFRLYLKPLKGGRGHWKLLCSGWGDLPLPVYRGKKAVYAHADVHEWILRLVARNIVCLVTDCPQNPDGYRVLRKKELLHTLPIEDSMTVFGIRSNDNPCIRCGQNAGCPLRKTGVAVSWCGYGMSTL